MPHCPLLAPPPSNLRNSLPVTPPSPPDSSVTGQFFFSLIYNWHLTQKCLYVLVIRVRVFNMKNIFDASLQYTHFFKSEFLNLLGVFVPSTEKIVLIKTCFSYTCMYLHIASYKDQVNRALIFFFKKKKSFEFNLTEDICLQYFFYYDSTIILHLHYAYSMMHFLLFCSVSASLLPSSLTHPTALSVCWPGNFPLSFPSYISCVSNVASIAPYLRQPAVLVRAVSHSRCLGLQFSSPPPAPLLPRSQPEWGTITSSERACNAWSTISIFTESWDDKFHSVPSGEKKKKNVCFF